MTVVLLEPAVRELDEAIAFYNSQVDGLGDTFLIEFLRAADLIERHPQAWQKLGLNTRRCRLSRFPYGLVYACETDRLSSSPLPTSTGGRNTGANELQTKTYLSEVRNADRG